MARLKVGVLISGRGTNLQSLLDACAEPAFPAEIVLVISNQPEATGLGRAEKAGCATRTIDHREYPDRPSFDAALDQALDEAGVDFVCLAGFMRVLSEGIVERWRDRMINIHPSLLPSFKGLHAQEQALAAGVRLAGATVHFVRPAADTGPIIVQAAVPVGNDDDALTLAARVLEAEHRIYPLALGLIARGRVSVIDELVVIAGMETAPGTLINPPEAGR